MYTWEEVCELRDSACEEAVEEALEKVFKYGDATSTHLNILDLLNELKIPRQVYCEWNQET